MVDDATTVNNMQVTTSMICSKPRQHANPIISEITQGTTATANLNHQDMMKRRSATTRNQIGAPVKPLITVCYTERPIDASCQ